MATRPTYTPTGELRTTAGSGTGEIVSGAQTATVYRNFYGEFDNTTTSIVWADGEGDIVGSPSRGSGLIAPTNDLTTIGLDPTDSVLFDTENFVLSGDLDVQISGFTEGEYVLTFYNHEGFFTNPAGGERVFAYLEVNGIQFAANHDPVLYAVAETGTVSGAYKLEQTFNVGVDGLVNFKVARSVQNPKIDALKIARNVPSQLDDVFLNFPNPYLNATIGRDWLRGTEYIINPFGTNSSGNVGEAFQGPVENLSPPLDPNDQVVVESTVWSQGQTDIQIEIPNVKAGLRQFAIYAVQLNAPPIASRIMDVDLQQGATTFQIDISNTNAAVVGSGTATIADQGDGYGTAYITVTDVADQASIAALTILDPASALTELHLNVGVLQDLTVTSGQLWTGDDLYIKDGVQDTTQANLLNMPVYGLDPAGVNDNNVAKSERRGDVVASNTFTVENGYYGVQFLFREAIWSNSGERLMDVIVNGITQTTFDIIAVSTKKDVMVSYYTTVQVTDTMLNFQLDGTVGGSATTEATLSGFIFKKLVGTATGQLDIVLVDASGTPYASLSNLIVHVYEATGNLLGPLIHHEPKASTDASGRLQFAVPFKEVGDPVFFSVTDDRPLNSVARISFFGAATLT